MKRNKVLIFGLITLLGCSNVISHDNINKEQPTEMTANTFKEKAVKDTSLIDFFKNSTNCTMRLSHGALQGTNHSIDSTGYLGFAGFYNCQTTYELIFLYKDVFTRVALGYDSLSRIFFNKQVQKSAFQEFDCYAFVLPIRDPEQQADIHEMPIDFPVNVKAYKRIKSTTWQFKGELKAKTFEEYSEFQFKVIYGLNPSKR